MSATEFAGFVGVGLAGIAYLPQIVHLIAEHCSAGISRLAFAMWLISSFLVTTHAIATHADVFVVLGAIQILSTLIILVNAIRFHGSYCAIHLPRYLDASTTISGKPDVARRMPGLGNEGITKSVTATHRHVPEVLS